MASYLTIEEATEILTLVPGSSSWFGADEALKLSSLSYASNMLDSFFDWEGVITSQVQDLRWPRTGAYDRDGRLIDPDSIPKELRDATAILALELASNDINGSVPDNLKSLKVGPVSLGFDTSSDAVSNMPIPQRIISMLSALGLYTGPRDSNTAYNVKVLR